MASQPVNLSAGLPETVLPFEPDEQRQALERAMRSQQPIDEVEKVVAADPRLLAGWAALGDVAGSPMARYAAYRVGYHRGLDALRAAGWRGTGYVRWGKGGNDAFLRCLTGLGAIAAEIGETDEAERIQTFVVQLDPSNGGAGSGVDASD